MAEAKRRLAAILAADVAGYSRLMAADERATMDTLGAYREVFRTHISGHDGRVVDTAGDSVLAVFDSVVEAVHCAVDVQAELATRNADLSDDRKMRFRIGVNLGDVFEQADGTLYGDGVNVAARLEGLAGAGDIVVSEDAFRQVRGKIDASFDDLGEHQVKNIAEPVRAYLIGGGDSSPRSRRRRITGPRILTAAAIAVAVAAGVWQAGWLGRTAFVEDAAQFHPSLPTGASIAVLPFTNLSDDPDQEYFSDGLTEDVTAALGRFSDLFVLAGNATMHLKGTTVSAQEIGRELGVDYLLEGSVRRAGDQIRVSAQVTDAKTGQHLWSDRYDSAFDNLFSVQDEITRNVAGACAAQLTWVERERVADKPTDNFAAYDLVVHGWNLIGFEDRASLFEARDLFKRAIEIDPDYAAAYAGLGATHQWAAAFGYTEFISTSIERAEGFATQALRLDPNNVEALRLLAFVNIQKREYDLAADHLRRALEINPSDADIYKDYGIVLVWSGHEQGAIEWFDAAIKLDPNMRSHRLNDFALAHYLNGTYDDAITIARQAIAKEPDYYFGYAMLAAAQAQLGQAESARQAAKRTLRLKPFFTIDWFTASFRDVDDAAHMAVGLNKAGFPRSAVESNGSE